MIINFFTWFARSRPSIFSFAEIKMCFNWKPFFTFYALFFTFYDKLFSMIISMFRATTYQKIFNSIVEFVSVDMVDKLRYKKFSTKRFLYNQSMNFIRFPIHFNSIISIWRDSSFFSCWRNRIAIMSKSITVMRRTITLRRIRIFTTFNSTFFHTKYDNLIGVKCKEGL